MRTLLLLLFCAAAAPADPVDFTPSEKEGDRSSTTEEEYIDGKIHYKSVRGRSKVDFGKRKQEFLSIKRWTYEQKIVPLDPTHLAAERAFSVATKEELEEDGKGHKKTQFPHHQRTCKVGRGAVVNYAVIDGEKPEEELQEQGWIDVAPCLLPKEPIAEGKEYDIDAKTLIKAWSKGAFDEKNSSGSGKGKFREVVTVGKTKCAKLWVNVTMKGEGKDLPGIETSLQGWVLFAIEEKKVVKLELTGPITLKMRVKDTPDVGDVDLTIDGTLKETMTVDLAK